MHGSVLGILFCACLETRHRTQDNFAATAPDRFKRGKEVLKCRDADRQRGSCQSSRPATGIPVTSHCRWIGWFVQPLVII